MKTTTITPLLHAAHTKLFLPATALLLAACTAANDDTTHDAVREPRAIAFDAYSTQALTRSDSALQATFGIPGGKSIGVYAYYHNNTTWNDAAKPDFMWNQQATNVSNDEPFSYAPLKYWPNEEGDKLSFMAYYPYVASGTEYGITPLLTNSGTGLPTFDFTVNDNVKQQVDFLVSALMPNLPHTRDTEGDPELPLNDLTVTDRVRFMFYHMTAKIEFRITVDDDVSERMAYFTLHSLGITSIYTKGTLTPTYAAGTGTTFVWSGHDTKHDYPCKTTEAYLLLPQPIQDDARLNIRYDLAFKSDGTTYEYDDDGNPVATDIYIYRNREASIQLNKLKVTGTDEPLTEWLPNHHYVYTIRLGAHRIDFTGQVAEWGEVIWLPL